MNWLNLVVLEQIRVSKSTVHLACSLRDKVAHLTVFNTWKQGMRCSPYHEHITCCLECSCSRSREFFINSLTVVVFRQTKASVSSVHSTSFISHDVARFTVCNTSGIFSAGISPQLEQIPCCTYFQSVDSERAGCTG